MANLLFLVHRLPYPPNKGDKVRSYHLLRHLQQSHRVFLGTFVDDPEDEQHVSTLKKMCPDLHVERLRPGVAKLRSLRGLISRDALTLGYYRSAAMKQWVEEVIARHPIQMAMVVSSAMAQYLSPHPSLPLLVDLVDVDSAKWSQYADTHHWPWSWVYGREANRLLAHERRVVRCSRKSFLVSDKETALFAGEAPECRDLVATLGNGVNVHYFAPDVQRPTPYAQGEQAIVFVGTMNYWPNVDAVVWFVSAMLPRIVQRWPRARFHIVGRHPAPAVTALVGPHVSVTGTVADVRPYFQHASVVVAPMRMTPGMPNKVLEAMAMARPVLTVPVCAEIVGATEAQGLLRAESAEGFIDQTDRLLGDPVLCDALGRSGREFVANKYRWDVQMAALDLYLPGAEPQEFT